MRRGFRNPHIPRKSIDYRKEDYVSFLLDNKRLIRQSLVAFFMGFFVLMTYIYLGAVLFFYIEHCWTDYKLNMKSNLGKTFVKMCKYLEDFQDKQTNFTNDSSTFQELIRNCQSVLFNLEPKCVLSEANFFKWTEFTISVCFTVGYGNVVPLTTAGKMSTIAYAIPGITMAITTYTFIAKVFLSLTKIVIFYVEIKLLNHKIIEHLNLKTLLSQLTLIIIILFTQAGMSTLSITEDYEFVDAIYFVFVALTTIGFGDYDFRAGAYHQRPDLYLICSICYFGGFGLIASLLTLASEMMSNSEMAKVPKKLLRYLCKKTSRKKCLERECRQRKMSEWFDTNQYSNVVENRFQNMYRMRNTNLNLIT